MTERSAQPWLAWLLKRELPATRDEEQGVARFTVLEIWLSSYVTPSLQDALKCCVEDKNKFASRSESFIDLWNEFYECLRK